MSNTTPVEFSREQLEYLEQNIPAVLSETFSYALGKNKTRQLMADLFKAPNRDAVFQRAKVSVNQGQEKANVVMSHQHRYGTDARMIHLWGDTLREGDLPAIAIDAGFDYEPERDESIHIHYIDDAEAHDINLAGDIELLATKQDKNFHDVERHVFTLPWREFYATAEIDESGFDGHRRDARKFAEIVNKALGFDLAPTDKLANEEANEEVSGEGSNYLKWAIELDDFSVTIAKNET